MEELAFAFREELREGGAIGPVLKKKKQQKIANLKKYFLDRLGYLWRWKNAKHAPIKTQTMIIPRII